MRSVVNDGIYIGPVNSFTTPPAVGAGSTLRYIAWADSGQAYNDGTPTVVINVHARCYVSMEGQGFSLKACARATCSALRSFASTAIRHMYESQDSACDTVSDLQTSSSTTTTMTMTRLTPSLSARPSGRSTRQ